MDEYEVRTLQMERTVHESTVLVLVPKIKTFGPSFVLKFEFKQSLQLHNTNTKYCMITSIM